jgi:hypothetical protein
MNNSFQDILSSYTSLGLQDLEQDAFFNRIDRKYLGHRSLLPEFLNYFSQSWKVLEVDGLRIQSYKSQYFDDEKLRSFFDHHNQRNNRQKFRLRTYENGVSFFEIKTKNNKGLIEKNRLLVDKSQPLKIPAEFIVAHSSRDAKDLVKNITVDYKRITLINETTDEKITIDTDISFNENGVVKGYDSLLIVELKQKVFSKNLETIIDLRKMDLYSISCSKYCLGIINLREKMKQNRFKRKIRLIQKIESIAV